MVSPGTMRLPNTGMEVWTDEGNRSVPGRARRVRPRSQWSSHAMTSTRIGLDIGGTKTEAVVVAQGRVVARSRVATAPGRRGVLKSVAQALNELDADYRASAAVGLGVPGVIDRRSGTVRHAVNLGIADEPFPLATEVAEIVGSPVMLENDLNAAAWGAHVVSGTNDLAYLSLGTGIAAGLVLDGVLRRGAYGLAGEVGHIPHDTARGECGCGQRGCLELSTSGLALQTMWPHADPPLPAVLAAADRGDATAVAVRRTFLDGLADAIRILALTVDPAVIMLGGGVARIGAPLLSALATAMREQAAESEFVASLNLASRLELAPTEVPLGALGAAMITLSEAV